MVTPPESAGVGIPEAKLVNHAYWLTQAVGPRPLARRISGTARTRLRSACFGEHSAPDLALTQIPQLRRTRLCWRSRTRTELTAEFRLQPFPRGRARVVDWQPAFSRRRPAGGRLARARWDAPIAAPSARARALQLEALHGKPGPARRRGMAIGAAANRGHRGKKLNIISVRAPDMPATL